MKTKFYWVALLASAAMIAQAKAGGYHGGGGGSFAAHASAGPAFHSAPMHNFSGGRFVAPGQRFSAIGMRSSNAFRQQGFVGSNRGAFVSRYAGASGVINHRGNRSATIGSQGTNLAQNHILARRTANWHRDWDRGHDHWWHGHRCRFVNGEWFIFDWYPYDYPYDYYASDYYPDQYDPSAYDSSEQGADSPIVAAQEQLTRQGYYRGEIDGIFGAATRRAVMLYQRDHGLRVTGDLTTDTIRAMGLPQVANN
jgi:hypothetical protein